MEITKSQRKLVMEIYGKGDFYEVEDILYFHNPDVEKTYRVDFDKQVYKRVPTGTPPANKKKEEDTMENKEQEREDLTKQQYEENYWKTTVETKLDGSALAMELRISKCMEASGKSREVCSKEVKERMKKEGSENTNTKDMDANETEVVEEVVDEVVEEQEKPKEDMKEKVEVCKEKLDMLESFYEDNKEKEVTLAARLDSLESTIAKYKAKESQKLDESLNERIAKISTDFVISEEEIRKILDGKKGKEGLKIVNDMEILLDLAVKKEVSSEEGETWNSADYLSKAETIALDMRKQLRHVD